MEMVEHFEAQCKSVFERTSSKIVKVHMLDHTIRNMGVALSSRSETKFSEKINGKTQENPN